MLPERYNVFVEVQNTMNLWTPDKGQGGFELEARNIMLRICQYLVDQYYQQEKYTLVYKGVKKK